MLQLHFVCPLQRPPLHPPNPHLSFRAILHPHLPVCPHYWGFLSYSLSLKYSRTPLRLACYQHRLQLLLPPLQVLSSTLLLFYRLLVCLTFVLSDIFFTSFVVIHIPVCGWAWTPCISNYCATKNASFSRV